MNCWNANSISTFGGNPLAACGALADLEYVLKHDLQKNAAERGAQLRPGLDGMAKSRSSPTRAARASCSASNW